MQIEDAKGQNSPRVSEVPIPFSSLTTDEWKHHRQIVVLNSDGRPLHRKAPSTQLESWWRGLGGKCADDLGIVASLRVSPKPEPTTGPLGLLLLSTLRRDVALVPGLPHVVQEMVWCGYVMPSSVARLSWSLCLPCRVSIVTSASIEV